MDSDPLRMLLVIYAGVNILAFAVFFSDKLRARMKTGRSAENSLLLVAALGPAGALAAMTGFRHKTRHIKFFLVPVFLILHVLLLVWLWPRTPG